MTEELRLIITVGSGLIMFWWAQNYLLLRPKQKYFNWAIGGSFIMQSIFQLLGIIFLQLVFFTLAIGLWYFQTYSNKKFDQQDQDKE